MSHIMRKHDFLHIMIWEKERHRSSVLLHELKSAFVFSFLNKYMYRNEPMFSYKQVWVNSADPNQTASLGTV